MTASPLSQGDLTDLLLASALHRACLETLRDAELPDGWIGAGFLRNLVWDHLHGFQQATPLADVDVIYFDLNDPEGQQESDIEFRLRQSLARRGQTVKWEAKNQARMHRRNEDPPYRDCCQALEHWLETPTAVAVRLTGSGFNKLEYLAPFGFDDLFSLIIRPTPHALSRADRLSAYHRRLKNKPWTAAWPNLTLRDR